MEEIKTKIDQVFEFIQKKRKTTRREVSRQVKLSGEEFEKYIYVLRTHGMIKVKYDWFDTHLCVNEDETLKLADEFKSQFYADAESIIVLDKEQYTADKVDRTVKALAFMSIIKTE